jgi:hypothetical protein
MPTFFIGLLIVTGLVLLLVYAHYKHVKAKQMKQFLHLSEQGTKNELSFSSQEMVGHTIIGLDGIRRKLLLLEEKNGKEFHYTIDLEEIESCTLKKTYHAIKAGDLKRKKIEDFIDSIALQFAFKNRMHYPVSLNFYESSKDSPTELKQRALKAKKWQTVLSKLLTKQEKKIA